MCGALAMRLPSGSNRAQEKSSRSLMLTECAVFSRRTPICSAMAMKRLLNTSRQDRVGVGADRGPRWPGPHAGQDQFARVAGLGLPVGVDHGGGVGLGDDRGSRHDAPGPSEAAVVEGYQVHGARRVHLDPCPGSDAVRVGLYDRFAVLTGGADRLHRDRLHHQGGVHGEPVAGAVGGGEGVGHGGGGLQRYGQGRVRTGVSEQYASTGGDGRVREVVGGQVLVRLLGEFGAQGVYAGGRVVVEFRFYGPFAHGGGVGEADAVGGEHPGERWHDHGGRYRARRRPRRRAGRPRRRRSSGRSG